ncbi:MAG: Nif3-like dinuclear metal center hexameric protein [Zoogloeaceae bacterium]|jgi:dinuclear metal center YbgI/SA1388 family protein|nr:Nif3-like dinuclear metal center hexameric protein [Zoogloeaceae bacterium]
MNRNELERFLEDSLESAKFEDYSPNGLQVEGRQEISRIITGVTASQALLDAAILRGADTLIVHHGYFWKGESPRIVGYRRQRLATLLRHDLNLFAYHLPLDAHPTLGNNARWAAALGWQTQGHFGAQDIGCWGELPGEGCTLAELAAQLRETLGRPPLVIGEATRPLKRIAWCSGGAQNYIEAARALGVDAYLSGEISEQTPHVARETGLAYLACGHHATERFGPQALAEAVQATFAAAGVTCEFVEVENPA